jgi:hypothetical protein
MAGALVLHLILAIATSVAVIVGLVAGDFGFQTLVFGVIAAVSIYRVVAIVRIQNSPPAKS